MTRVGSQRHRKKNRCVGYNYKDRSVSQTQLVFDSLFYPYNGLAM